MCDGITYPALYPRWSIVQLSLVYITIHNPIIIFPNSKLNCFLIIIQMSQLRWSNHELSKSYP